MKKQLINLRFGTITGIILLAALSRLVPHPANFAPIGGMALFGAAYFGKKYWAFLIPIISMWLSDLLLNNVVYGAYFDHFIWFYSGSVFTYGAFVLITLLGFVTLKRVTIGSVTLSALSASILFFAVSNFGVWATSMMYPHTLAGLISCYAAGIPFFGNTLLGDLFYCAIMFGSFATVAKHIPQLQLARSR